MRPLYYPFISQIVIILACLLLSLWVSEDWDSIILFFCAAWLVSGSTAVVLTHTDSGISLALFGPLFGLAFFLPFMVPVNDRNPLILLWVVWLVVSAVLIQFRAVWSSSFQGDVGRTTAPVVRTVLEIETLVSSVLFLGILAALFGMDVFAHRLSILLAIALPIVGWFILPFCRESLYSHDETKQAREQHSKLNDDRIASRRQVDGMLVRPFLATGFLFLSGLFLPMYFAITSGSQSGYVLPGILFLGALIIRANRLRA